MATKWKTFLFATRFWQPLTDLWARVTDWPLIGRLARIPLNERHYDVTFIPINRELEAGSTVLPKEVAYRMVERASHRVILPLCLCRVGCRCQDYPMEVGCIFLGEATKEIDTSMGKPATVEEAKAHLDRGIAAGLIPQIGKVDPDPYWLGVKDRYRFITLCLCCRCCCIAMRNMPRWSPRVKSRMHRLPGLSVDVLDTCNGCGKCAGQCFAGAIRVEGGRAAVSDECKGCGICASVCPESAIRLTVRDGREMAEEFFRRIDGYSNVTSAE